MLTISRETDYAVRLMVHMATQPDVRHQAKTIARQESIPESFLFKILQTLIKRRLLTSFRGFGGGYQLAVDPESLSLYRLLEAVEGPIGLNVCVVSGIGCELTTQCGVHDIWGIAQAQLRKTLEGISVAELSRRTQEKRARFAEQFHAPPELPSAASSLD